MLPRVGSRSPVSSRNRVVFPLPLRPTMPQRSPGATVKVMSENSFVAPKSTPTPANAICVMWRQLNYRLDSTRAFIYVSPWRAAARVLAPAVQAPGRQDAVQSHGRLDDAVLRDDRRAGGGPRAGVVSRDAPRPPSRAQSSRVGARDGAGEPRGDGEWPRGSGGTPAGGPRDRYRFLDLLPQESPWFVDGRVPREAARGDRRAGVRGAGRG